MIKIQHKEIETYILTLKISLMTNIEWILQINEDRTLKVWSFCDKLKLKEDGLLQNL